MKVDAIDRVIKDAIHVMESSKYKMFEISESARNEMTSLSQELELVMQETERTIDLVDAHELRYRKSRIRLTEVSRDFHRFTETDIRVAYEAANQLQLQLTIFREKETHLKVRRDELQQRLRNVERQVERAEILVSQMNIVLEYLSGDLNQVTQMLESAKNRQMVGLRIIVAQEEERKRIAREIHDGLAQTMAHLVLRSEITERMLMKREYDSVKEELIELKGHVREGLEEVRKFIFNLRPMALDDLGLIPTLRMFVQDFEEKTGIHTQFTLLGRETRLPSAMEVAIYRLIQEVFSNVVKHAKASFISLEMTFQRHMVKIEMKDDGIGFDVTQVESTSMTGNHFGLMGMRERVDLLEGRMDIESSKGEGTRTVLLIPIGPELGEE